MYNNKLLSINSNFFLFLFLIASYNINTDVVCNATPKLMEYLNLAKFSVAKFQSETFHLKIEPFEYLDGRKPRLPRKNSTKYKLRADTKFYFEYVFQKLKTKSSTAKYKVDIVVFNGQDRLGGAELDNYCKAILDGVIATKKVWKDDKQVDELNNRRIYISDQSSYIKLKIEPLKHAV